MNFYSTIIFIGAIAAIALLIFPKINYIIKAILVTLISVLLSCISIILLTWNIAYLIHDNHELLILIASIYGVFASILVGFTVLTIMISKENIFKKYNK